MALGQMPTTSFLWGRGGRKRSMEDIDYERRLAAQQIATGSDFSPVESWTQGLARVANSVAGSLQMNRADKAAEERQAAQEQSIAALLADYDPASGAPDPVVAALADPELRQLGMQVLKSRTPASVEPVIKQRNDGSYIGLHPVTGEIMFERADPNPKPAFDWLMVDDPVTGAKQLVPVGPNGPIMGGGDPASGAAGAPPATLPPDFDFGEEGGPASQAPASFSGGFRGLPGETVTSTYRDPAKNRAVGGVANSFHMRRDAQGRPMARDSVPPPGMPMGEYARRLAALNPHLEVINEGDHVHMEPRG